MPSFCSSSFHLLSLFCPLIFSFLSPFSDFFKLPLLVKFIVHHLYVSLCKTLCQKIFILLDCSKTLFFYLLFSVKISVFSVSFFAVPFSDQFIFSMFCFLSLEKMVSHFCVTLLFLILRFKCVSLFFLSFFLMYPRTKKVFDGNDGKTIFCILFLISCFLKRHRVCAKNPSYFPLFFETVWILFSLHFKAQKNRKKLFIFCFSSVPFFVFLQSTFFPFSLSSLLSLFTFSFRIFVHLYLLFSPLSFLSFLLPFFFFSSVSLSHTSVPHVSLSLFSPAPFLCIFFWTNSFFFSLLILISLFSYFFFTFFSVSSSPSLFFSSKKS